MERLILTLNCPDAFYAAGVRLALSEHLAAQGIRLQTAAEAAKNPYSTHLVLLAPGIAAPVGRSPELNDSGPITPPDCRTLLWLEPHETVASLLARVDALLQRRTLAWRCPVAGLRRLSPQEHRVLRLIGRGLSSVAIAHQLHLHAKTVSAHKRNAMKKLNITRNTQLLHWLLNGGIK
ncbi:LuxR C-terminal-related transcriptional regulator [Serratia proteamaculans]|uniref:helix-turn-helix transcriptional regulator n=1 Tax=Serratia proteamaculans TaxID=28151 RepID=UPI002177A523|nr:helix-turn-helix transcriptional regulator [Serratia proteamaculans]CAI1556019.1 Capsular synthesis regulator component B [Serratia proteamaculans]CAI2468190.1 Capsular synthesis regulator component B [Serratia proteamaculans]